MLTASNTYTTPTTISAGTLQLGDGSASNGYVSGNIADNAVLAFANPNAQTYGGVISGKGAMTKSGTSLLTLNSESSYTGGTTVNGGTLVLNSGNGSGYGTIRGTLNINPGAYVQLNEQDALGWNGNQVSTVNIAYGVMNAYGSTQAFSTNFLPHRRHDERAERRRAKRRRPISLQADGYGITTYAGTATSLISAAIEFAEETIWCSMWPAGPTPSGIDLNVTGQISRGRDGNHESRSGRDGARQQQQQLQRHDDDLRRDAPTGRRRVHQRQRARKRRGQCHVGLRESDRPDLWLHDQRQRQRDRVRGGRMTLSGNNVYSGPTTVNAGTLQIGNGTSGEGLSSPTIALNNGATLAFNHADGLSYGGAISGAGSWSSWGPATST